MGPALGFLRPGPHTTPVDRVWSSLNRQNSNGPPPPRRPGGSGKSPPAACPHRRLPSLPPGSRSDTSSGPSPRVFLLRCFLVAWIWIIPVLLLQHQLALRIVATPPALYAVAHVVVTGPGIGPTL